MRLDRCGVRVEPARSQIRTHPPDARGVPSQKTIAQPPRQTVGSRRGHRSSCGVRSRRARPARHACQTIFVAILSNISIRTVLRVRIRSWNRSHGSVLPGHGEPLRHGITRANSLPAAAQDARATDSSDLVELSVAIYSLFAWMSLVPRTRKVWTVRVAAETRTKPSRVRPVHVKAALSATWCGVDQGLDMPCPRHSHPDAGSRAPRYCTHATGYYEQLK